MVPSTASIHQRERPAAEVGRHLSLTCRYCPLLLGPSEYAHECLSQAAGQNSNNLNLN